jgi:predicted nucleic acid-binding protein
MKILPINESSKHLPAVKDLWQANRSMLGLFPAEAFDGYAKRQQILVALNPDDHCAGYLLYRICGKEIRIVHLCVESTFRRHGAATALVEYLKLNTPDFKGIGLKCRRDYEANTFWPKLGFVTLASLSRGRDLLNYWWLGQTHFSGLAYAGDMVTPSKIKAVIDTSVFYDLQDKSRPNHEESKALVEDWIKDDLIYCLTDELYPEINRNEFSLERSRYRAIIDNFPRLTSSDADVAIKTGNLDKFFPQPANPGDEPDLRQLARAISANAHFFITYQASLLAISDAIYFDTGISIVSPGELIVRIDELIKGSEYQPSRLDGSTVERAPINSGEFLEFMDKFQNPSQGETKMEYRQQLYRFLSFPHNYEILIIRDAARNALALIVLNRQKEHLLEIPVFRVTPNILSKTVARRLILHSVLISVKENRYLTKITDQYVNYDAQTFLEESTFSRVGTNWIKFNLPAVEPVAGLTARLNSLHSIFPNEKEYLRKLADTLGAAFTSQDYQALFEIERLLQPVKISELDQPSYIVPITPGWAIHLFDEKMAGHTLFGAKNDLAPNDEKVYYRTKSSAVFSSPARILWYVSDDWRFPASKHITACSCLEEAVNGKPQDLLQRFRRLGLYEWKEVTELAKKDRNGEITALQFRDTEVFDQPVRWETLKELLAEELGIKSELQSPLKISNECFLKLYRMGFKNTAPLFPR